MDDTPPQSRARPPQLLFKPKANPPSSPPPPAPISFSSATTSPSHDDFSFPSPFGGHLQLPLPMSRTPVVGRVGSDLSHLSHARANHRHATTSNSGITSSSKDSRDRDSSSRARAKNKAPPFFSGLGGAWRKEGSSSSSSDVTGKQRQAEENSKRKDRAAKKALDDVGQWVKRHMASVVEQLRASFSRRQSERERRRPHSFSGLGPGAVREMRERERWRRRRGQLSSAPASLRVSPANSGHLSVGGSVKVSTSSEESTMEELQSAIEAAIAHCKNSISVAKQTAAGDDASKLQ